MKGETIWVFHGKQASVSNHELSLKWAMTWVDTHTETFWLWWSISHD